MGLRKKLREEVVALEVQARMGEDARVAEALIELEENEKQWVVIFSQACRAQGLPTPVKIEVPANGFLGFPTTRSKVSRMGSHPGVCGLPILFQLDDILLLLTGGGPVDVSTGWGNTERVGGGEASDPNIFMLWAWQSEHEVPGFYILLPKKVKSWNIGRHFVATLSEFSREKLAAAVLKPSGLSTQEMLRLIKHSEQ